MYYASLGVKSLKNHLQAPVMHIESKYTVGHFSYAPHLRAHNFSQKCWNRTFSMIIYLLIFNLFDDIKKISESLMRIIVIRQR